MNDNNELERLRAEVASLRAQLDHATDHSVAVEVYTDAIRRITDLEAALAQFVDEHEGVSAAVLDAERRRFAAEAQLAKAQWVPVEDTRVCVMESRLYWSDPHGDGLLHVDLGDGSDYVVCRRQPQPAAQQSERIPVEEIRLLLEWMAIAPRNPEVLVAFQRVNNWLQERQPLPAAPGPQPDWSAAPEWAQFWAMDMIGVACWYRNAPEIGDFDGWALANSDPSEQYELVQYPNWRTTLQRRPQAGAGGAV